MSTELVKTTDQQLNRQEPLSVFGSISGFEAAQRMARALCSSAMVPETYRGDANIGSCLIAIEMANRIGANVLSVCQNLYVIHGRPAWSSQFLIACVNASGRFSPLRYTMTGDKGSDTMGCIAWATDKTGEKLESPEITIGIAKAEGWFQKNGSKWKTMPELMLRYRTATLFARLYAPELTMGIHTEDEVIDVVEIAPVVTSPVFVPKMIEVTPAPKKKEAKTVTATAELPPEIQQAKAEVLAEVGKNTSEGGLVSTESSEPSFEQVVDGESKELTDLRAAMALHQVSETQVIKFLFNMGFCFKANASPPFNLSDILPAKVIGLTKNILANGATLKKLKEGV